jgi:hypothetical protein
MNPACAMTALGCLAAERSAPAAASSRSDQGQSQRPAGRTTGSPSLGTRHGELRRTATRPPLGRVGASGDSGKVGYERVGRKQRSGYLQNTDLWIGALEARPRRKGHPDRPTCGRAFRLFDPAISRCPDSTCHGSELESCLPVLNINRRGRDRNARPRTIRGSTHAFLYLFVNTK